VFAGERQEAVHERVEVAGGKRRREAERQEGDARPPAHRRDIGEVDRKRLPADVEGGAEPAIEVDALDEAVGGEDFERAALRFHDGRIVADADGEPGRRRRKLGADVGDDPALSEIRDARATGRTQRRASRG